MGVQESFPYTSLYEIFFPVSYYRLLSQDIKWSKFSCTKVLKYK